MQRQAIERLLPAAFQRAAVDGSPLAALLDVMEAMHAPDEAVLADIDDLFAPYRAPDRFIAYLARWVALDHLVNQPRPGVASQLMPIGRLRDLVAQGATLARWRGTPYGMRLALRTATGVDGFVIDEPVDRPFHIVVRVPQAAAAQLALIVRLVEAEKPAATTSEVLVDPTLVQGEVPTHDH
jgi:phage tail-like protein